MKYSFVTLRSVNCTSLANMYGFIQHKKFIPLTRLSLNQYIIKNNSKCTDECIFFKWNKYLSMYVRDIILYATAPLLHFFILAICYWIEQFVQRDDGMWDLWTCTQAQYTLTIEYQEQTATSINRVVDCFAKNHMLLQLCFIPSSCLGFQFIFAHYTSVSHSLKTCLWQ